MGNIALLKSALQHPTSSKKILDTFLSYDLDKNGSLSRSEFHLFAQNLLTILETLPENNSAKIDLGSKKITDFADELFNKSDLNNNGSISFDEFIHIVHATSWK
jgi:Ca2+-binding EF-hand superfamily protein